MPCVKCVQLLQNCEFTAEYHRGHPPSPEFSGLEIPKSGGSASPITNDKSFGGTNESLSDENGQGVFEVDGDGQYVGSSSGISFLMRVQKRLHDIQLPNPSSSILSFGDPEFLDGNNSSCFILPPKTDAKAMLEFYFSYAMPTQRFLHKPTVEAWLEEFYETYDSTDLSEGSRERFAVNIMLFAHAKKYPAFAKTDTSALYFHAAEHQLRMETGRPRLTSVQARLCQCFYLLSCSRINHCRSLFCTTAHIIQALGLHRRQRFATTDYIEHESRKRVFWCAYSLDKYLSVVLGRPSIFQDADIDQDLPALVNDEDLSQAELQLGNRSMNCVMLAPVLHATLMRVISGVLRDLYGINKVTHSELVAMCGRYTKDLKVWRGSLPAFLDPARVQPSLLTTLLQRQSQMLTLAYAHAVILVNRPFLLTSFAPLTPIAESETPAATDDNAIEECVTAAVMVVELLDDLNETAQFFSALWFTQYVAFCAVVVLYVHTIRNKSQGRADWQRSLALAMKCQRQIRISGEGSSLAQRYAVVLEELRLEVVKDRQVPMYYEAPAPMLNSQEMQAAAAIEGMPALLEDLTSWENFDTLVMDFIGTLPFDYSVGS